MSSKKVKTSSSAAILDTALKIKKNIIINIIIIINLIDKILIIALLR